MDGVIYMYYLIKDTLEECTPEECHTSGVPYVAVLTAEEWQHDRAGFDMGIDLEPDTKNILNTKAEVNYDSLTGTFAIPNRRDFEKEEWRFAFALDEKGVVFIDNGGYALHLIRRVKRAKKWHIPSLERFLYDFLEQIIYRDLSIMEGYERELDQIERDIQEGKAEEALIRVNTIRGELRDLKIHYDQLIDMGQELEENENGFFKSENVRYFRLFTNRMMRLYDSATSLQAYTVQVRDLYQAQLDIKQNRIMTVLTVVTTIFMPLTLIAGWYGMNFRYMPELESQWGYPIVIGVSLAIAIISLIFFKKKKWL